MESSERGIDNAINANDIEPIAIVQEASIAEKEKKKLQKQKINAKYYLK